VDVINNSSYIGEPDVISGHEQYHAALYC